SCTAPPPPTSTLFPYTTLFPSAIAEALVHYHTALELLEPDDGRRGLLLLDLGHAALLSGSDKEAEAAYTEALDWFLQRGEQETRSEAHTSELQSPYDLVCRLLL